jgi:predicted trehalose synthase
VSLAARGARAAGSANSEYDLACAAATAAALIELALSESLRPIGTLGEALSRVNAAVSAGAPPAGGDLDACIECLQFHDRMTQQLSQVRDLLAAVAATGSADVAPGGRQSWPVLIENLRARFTSDSHRILFNLLMPDAEGHSHAPSVHASEGSVELF